MLDRIIIALMAGVFSTAAFAGRDGSQMMLQDAANKKVIAERAAAAQSPDALHATQTTIDGQRTTVVLKPVPKPAVDANVRQAAAGTSP